MSNFVYINAQFVKAEDAKISVNNRGLNYGDGFFETIKIYNHKALFWNFHFERIVNTLKILQLECKELDKLESIIEKLCLTNECNGGARIKILFTRKSGGLYTPSEKEVDLIITYVSLANELYQHQQIENIGLYDKWTKSTSKFDNLKTISALIYVLASNQAKQNDFGDIFIKNTKGNIIESSNANVFVVKNGIAYTPSLSEGCLDGVFRKFLITNADALNIKIVEQEISEEFVLEADEVFTTNVIRGISSVGRFGVKGYRNEIAKRLVDKINALLLL